MCVHRILNLTSVARLLSRTGKSMALGVWSDVLVRRVMAWDVQVELSGYLKLHGPFFQNLVLYFI